MFKYIIPVILAFLFSSVANCKINILEILNTNPNNILPYVDENRAPKQSFLASITVIDKNLNQTNEFQLLVGVSSDGEKSFSIYKQPASQKGHTLLNTYKNMWFYVPGTQNPIKISPIQKLAGQASVADIASLTYYNNYRVVSFENNKSYKLKLEAINNNVAYKYIDLYINDDAMPVKAVFYSLSGKELKTMFFENLQPLAGKDRPTQMRITNALNTNLETTVIFKNIILQDIPESRFNKSFISQLGAMY